MTARKVIEVIRGRATSDGNGVNLLRVFGGPRPERFDPFLILDDFGSDNPDDYIAGFPPHPHRGFRTVTYMLQGHFEHRDHMGNVGGIKDGGAQWMTAGRGVIHSEMPKQTDGKLRGFQLWLNLPSKDKMMAPDYQNIESGQIAENHIDGVSIRAIAGAGQVNQQVVNSHTEIADTEPQIWYLSHSGKTAKSLTISQKSGRNVMIYIAQGELAVEASQWRGTAGSLVRFEQQGDVQISLGPDSEILLLAGQPLQEPIVQYGPFVMNSQAQIDQAITDYQNGALTTPAV
ncbi:pirin family protein [Neiella sp. HB171785]|uniref:Pirin family protein n=1 Tax=Neiella litorisoli TaxID=2771431 RepID=A0A8J6QGM3_9GAMM|nr:pirin family protein [Neiella litorisoli]MBD1387987.1 pirin family protein [Neiella litorisoli]